MTTTDHPRARTLIARTFIAMSNPRLAPGKGKSPRIVVSVSDAQRHALDTLSARTGRSTAELTREALDVWLIDHPLEEVAQAS
jgi:hypothetical protein